MSCWHETDSDLWWLSLTLLVSDPLRPEDRATGSPYVTFLAKRLPAGPVLMRPAIIWQVSRRPVVPGRVRFTEMLFLGTLDS
jgi:hypothetical protein